MKLITIITMFLVSATIINAQDVLVKSGDKVAFLGDSITQFGADSETGYVNLVASGLKSIGIDIKVVKAGISGHKSNQMLARLEGSVLKHKPQWMLLSCGVNDVWHGARGVNLEDYKKNITEIVDKATAQGVKVMILTATMITENPEAGNNKKLAGYNEFLRQLAKEKKLPLADLNADMQKEVKKLKDAGYKGNCLTRDGVHMELRGDLMMASGILRAFGLSEEQMATVNKAWMSQEVYFGFTPKRMSKRVIDSRHYPYMAFKLEDLLKKDLEINKKSGKNYNAIIGQEAQEALDKRAKK